MLSDIEIAESCIMQPITRIAAKLGLKEEEIEQYGRYKAKIDLKKFDPKAKLVLVTSINPTASGEGKTTVSIGLADGMAKLGKRVCLALREPSLGPVFGIKGGAAGGGYAQVVPMADINLHFTGDLHAITSANNLLCAVIDNHIFRGNSLKIKQVFFHRCMDMNDRALRDIILKCEAGKMKGCESYSRGEHFDITAALLMFMQPLYIKQFNPQHIIGQGSPVRHGRAVAAEQIQQDHPELFGAGQAVKHAGGTFHPPDPQIFCIQIHGIAKHLFQDRKILLQAAGQFF